MPKKWFLGRGSLSFVVTRRRDLFPEEQMVLDPSMFSANVERWIADTLSRRTLLEMYESVGGGRVAVGPTKARGNDLWPKVRRHLERTFRSGELVILPVGQLMRLVEAPEKPTPPPTKAPPVVEKKTTWIKFKVVDDQTSVPVLGVELEIKLPSGETMTSTTKSTGLIDITDIEPGVCTAASDIKYAQLTNMLKFMAMGESPTEKRKSKSNEPPEYAQSGESWRLAVIKSHKVKKNETLNKLADDNGLGWRDLASFNWGTSDPDDINEHLRDSVGCTKKTRDGRSYMFDDTDEPGIVFIPQQWKKEGLATEKTHTIRVKRLDRFLVILENDQTLRIPEAQYEAELADGSKVSGRLGRSGIAAIEDPPKGDVIVEFKDFDDIRAKSLAASARHAFDERTTDDIFHLLEQSPKMVKLAIAAYDKYFNDYTGKGLVEDIYQELTDPVALAAAEGALACAEAPTHGQVEYVAWED
jgi:LysM repeat protein